MAVVDVDDAAPVASGVKAEDGLAVGVAPRVLELVAVAPLGRGGDDRLGLEAVEAAEAAERLVDLRGLQLELALVGESLPRGAGTGLALVDAGVGDAVGARPR